MNQFNLLVNADHLVSEVRKIKEKELLKRAAKKETKAQLKGEARKAFTKAALSFIAGIALCAGGIILANLNVPAILAVAGVATTVFGPTIAFIVGSETMENLKKTYFNPTYEHVKKEMKQEQKQQRVAYDAQKENQATNKPASQSALKNALKIRAV